jgi:hypothetical protein
MPRMNKKNLTNGLIGALKPKTTRYVQWDSKVPNFGIRVYPSGHKSYVLRLTFRHPDTVKISERLHTVGDLFDFPDINAARNAAMELRRQYRAGIDAKEALQIHQARQLTLREGLEYY